MFMISTMNAAVKMAIAKVIKVAENCSLAKNTNPQLSLSAVKDILES